MNLEPLLDRVIVKPLDPDAVTPGGVVLPPVAQENAQRGVVVAVGPGARNERTGLHVPIELEPGDVIVYARYGGQEITLDGEDVLILRAAAGDILAVEA